MTATETTEPSGSADDVDERVRKRMEFSRALAGAGYTDVLTLSRESAGEVLTESRLEILDRLRAGDVPSVRALAGELGRDKAGVSRDLALLAEKDVVEYEETGRVKAPRLKHETVVVEPVP